MSRGYLEAIQVLLCSRRLRRQSRQREDQSLQPGDGLEIGDGGQGGKGEKRADAASLETSVEVQQMRFALSDDQWVLQCCVVLNEVSLKTEGKSGLE